MAGEGQEAAMSSRFSLVLGHGGDVLSALRGEQPLHEGPAGAALCTQHRRRAKSQRSARGPSLLISDRHVLLPCARNPEHGHTGKRCKEVNSNPHHFGW